jgi:hypothetical protein
VPLKDNGSIVNLERRKALNNATALKNRGADLTFKRGELSDDFPYARQQIDTLEPE